MHLLSRRIEIIIINKYHFIIIFYRKIGYLLPKNPFVARYDNTIIIRDIIVNELYVIFRVVVLVFADNIPIKIKNNTNPINPNNV